MTCTNSAKNFPVTRHIENPAKKFPNIKAWKKKSFWKKKS